MICEFNLSPINEVVPWGDSPNQTTHWFALTQGKYRLKVGDEYLLNYSQEYQDYCLKKFPQYPFPTRFIYYYVVRLWEDIIGMIPNILSPVPKEIQHILNSDYKTLSNWIETSCKIETDILNDWIWVRQFDSGYLSNPARIWIWSDEDNVNIHWDNRNVMDNDIPVWSATFGSYQINRDEFIENVKSFDNSLFAEMDERIETISTKWTNFEIKIDIEELKKEQSLRLEYLESNLKLSDKSNWDEITSAFDKN